MVVRLAVLLPVAAVPVSGLLYCLCRRWVREGEEEEEADRDSAAPLPVASPASVSISSSVSTVHMKVFPYQVLREATNSFSEEAMIGRGSFGDVYKGELENFGVVAVKKLTKFEENTQKDFITEVDNAGRVRHRNLVQIIGYCNEPKRLLIVFEYVDNGTLKDYLVPPSSCSCSSSIAPQKKQLLSWENRYKIALGLAEGVDYLHSGCRQCLIHRDIKPGNVLLDHDFTPQLGDLGLSRFTDHNKSMESTMCGGTVGYIAPEIFSHVSKASTASDMFSFGIVLLQTVTGRRGFNVEDGGMNLPLVSWVWHLQDHGRLLLALDGRLLQLGRSYYNSEQVTRLLKVGLRCCAWDSVQRPTMKEAISMLEGNSAINVRPIQGNYRDALISNGILPTPSQGPSSFCLEPAAHPASIRIPAEATRTSTSPNPPDYRSKSA